MLYYAIAEMCRLRGYASPYEVLLNCGMSRTTAGRLLRNPTRSLSLKFVEKLCVQLQCTPNDLLRYKPDRNRALPDSHPLLKLKQSRNELAGKLKNLSLEELQQLEVFFQQRKEPQ